jgi:creatinine amidohydrolase
MRKAFITFAIVMLCARAAWPQATLSMHWEELTAAATHERGEFEMKNWQDAIATGIHAVKADQESLKLQNEFFEKAKHPLDTRP